MKSQIPPIIDLYTPKLPTALKQVRLTNQDVNALLLIYKNLPKPKNIKTHSIPLDLIEAKQRYNINIGDTHYQYSGNFPIRDGKNMVIVNDNPVYSVDTRQTPGILVTTKTRELVDGEVQDMHKQQPAGFKGILPLGSSLKVSENTELVVNEGEEATNPVALMSVAIQQFASNLDQTDRESIQSIEIFEFLNLLQNLDDIGVEDQVVVGFGNDLGNSQGSTIANVQQAGSRLIDNCAELSDLPVADGGDGSEGSILTNLKDVNSMIMYSAYRDSQAVSGTELSVRSAYLAFNPLQLTKLTPSSTIKDRLSLLNYLAKIQASILQSTIKESEDNKNDKSAIVLSQQLATSLTFQGNSSLVNGSVPITKQSPAYYTSSPNSGPYLEHATQLNIVTIDTANISFNDKL
jgi:hypothetical protein